MSKRGAKSAVTLQLPAAMRDSLRGDAAGVFSAAEAAGIQQGFEAEEKLDATLAQVANSMADRYRGDNSRARVNEIKTGYASLHAAKYAGQKAAQPRAYSNRLSQSWLRFESTSPFAECSVRVACGDWPCYGCIVAVCGVLFTRRVR